MTSVLIAVFAPAAQPLFGAREWQGILGLSLTLALNPCMIGPLPTPGTLALAKKGIVSGAAGFIPGVPFPGLGAAFQSQA